MADGPALPNGEAPSQDPAPNEPTQQPEAPAAPPQPAARPRPAYGELAPEGWEWKPEGDATAQTAAPTAQATSPANGPAQTGAAGTQGGVGSTIPGVPHNLGAGLPKGPRNRAGRSGQAPHAPHGSDAQESGAQSTGTQSAANAPYRAAAPMAPAAHTQTPRYAGEARPRTVDRVITIVLLVLGAFSTLTLTSSLFALESQIRLTGTMLGVEDMTLASWVGPLGTVTGIVILAMYALTLIFSIRRMRARKLTFWVPLTMGVIALLLVLIIPTVAMLAGAPEIMQQLESDPNGSLDKMMKYMQQM